MDSRTNWQSVTPKHIPYMPITVINLNYVFVLRKWKKVLDIRTVLCSSMLFVNGNQVNNFCVFQYTFSCIKMPLTFECVLESNVKNVKKLRNLVSDITQKLKKGILRTKAKQHIVVVAKKGYTPNVFISRKQKADNNLYKHTATN